MKKLGPLLMSFMKNSNCAKEFSVKNSLTTFAMHFLNCGKRVLSPNIMMNLMDVVQQFWLKIGMALNLTKEKIKMISNIIFGLYVFLVANYLPVIILRGMHKQAIKWLTFSLFALGTT